MTIRVTQQPRNDSARIELALDGALDHAASNAAPPRLVRAIRHAVFPGGARLRPRLTLEVARAAGDEGSGLALAAAASVELLHCASLVHDDLPCFDGAALRRGAPSVQAAFGEATAVLVGDALIVLAFDVVARASDRSPKHGVSVLQELVRGVGAPSGIVAGQAWELEPEVPLLQLHRAKTGSLFAAAAAVGAVAVGAEPNRWREVGQLLGEAYQAADDLADREGDGDATPNLARRAGARAVRARLDRLLESAIDRVPPGPSRDRVIALVRGAAARLLPPAAVQQVAS